jgi:Fe-S-cluster containining protein
VQQDADWDTGRNRPVIITVMAESFVAVDTLTGRAVRHAARPVEVPWTCKRSGECCTIPKEVVMTKEEAAVLVHHAPPTITMQFRPLDKEGFVAMKAGPCPLYVFKTCLVYEHRPLNCRRFACMRPDPTTEPFEEMPNGHSLNAMIRFHTSRSARRQLINIQRKAQRWGRQHGWKVDDEPRST